LSSVNRMVENRIRLGGLTGPGTLEQRLRVLRNKRMAARLWPAITLAAWLAGVAAIVAVVGGSLLVVHQP
jgi:hypothetical protein